MASQTQSKFRCPHCGKPEKWVPWNRWNGVWEVVDDDDEPASEYSLRLQRGETLKGARDVPTEFDVCAHCGEVVT